MMDPELDADNPLLKKEQDAQVFDTNVSTCHLNCLNQ